MDWKHEAYHLYFDEHKSINDISKIVNRSRQSVSAFLNTKDIQKEKNNRKELSKCRQRVSNKNNMCKVRKEKRNMVLESALMKRQHIIDVNVISREKHFN